MGEHGGGPAGLYVAKSDRLFHRGAYSSVSLKALSAIRDVNLILVSGRIERRNSNPKTLDPSVRFTVGAESMRDSFF